MNKELTPLQALENIRTLFIGSPIDLLQQFDIIEKSLKDYESLKANFISMRDFKYKQLDALEIIKRKAKIIDYSPFEYPPLVIFQGFKIDNKEEYELLKEILNDKKGK